MQENDKRGVLVEINPFQYVICRNREVLTAICRQARYLTLEQLPKSGLTGTTAGLLGELIDELTTTLEERRRFVLGARFAGGADALARQIHGVSDQFSDG